MAALGFVFAGALVVVGVASWVRTRRLSAYLASLHPGPPTPGDLDRILGILWGYQVVAGFMILSGLASLAFVLD